MSTPSSSKFGASDFSESTLVEVELTVDRKECTEQKETPKIYECDDGAIPGPSNINIPRFQSVKPSPVKAVDILDKLQNVAQLLRMKMEESEKVVKESLKKIQQKKVEIVGIEYAIKELKVELNAEYPSEKPEEFLMTLEEKEQQLIELVKIKSKNEEEIRNLEKTRVLKEISEAMED